MRRGPKRRRWPSGCAPTGPGSCGSAARAGSADLGAGCVAGVAAAGARASTVEEVDGRRARRCRPTCAAPGGPRRPSLARGRSRRGRRARAGPVDVPVAVAGPAGGRAVAGAAPTGAVEVDVWAGEVLDR